MARTPKITAQSLNRTRTSPIPVNRSLRRLDQRVLTSMPAGKMVPLAAWHMHREDALKFSRFRCNFQMDETVDVLMNAVGVNVKAYLVPYLAFERFNGIDQLNRSYMGQKEQESDAAPVPFFTTVPFKKDSMPIFTYMGKHARENQPVNSAYIEAYNLIWNFRAANRSPDITPRALTDTSLAKAFWQHSQFANVVPDFDQALIDGEVALNVVNSKMPVLGLGLMGTPQTIAAAGSFGMRQSDGTTATTYPGWQVQGQGGTLVAGTAQMAVKQNTDLAGDPNFPDIWAELQDNGITVSLSNIELARKTQAFAALRKQYTGLNDDYVIDMLMQGLTVAEQAWRQPILLADKSTIYGMSKRYASSADDLTASVANGATFLDLAMGTPRVPTGGVVMIMAEIAPEQLFERQPDPIMLVSATSELPDFLRDTLDPEKVEVVENQHIDIDHSTPTGTFGYAPLNWQWNSASPGIGGKFYRAHVDDPFDEDRNRIWAVETKDPTLSEDFYLVTDMNYKPFVVTDQDPFECVMRGITSIEGNTVFGHVLLEASDDYESIMAEAPTDRIDKDDGVPDAEKGEAHFDENRESGDTSQTPNVEE